MDPFLGEIRIFGFTYAPRGWALCNGQILPIRQNTALFALIGTYYGGDGQTTFALPDLQGKVALNQGQGPGLSSYSIGSIEGSASVTLISDQVGLHTHDLNADLSSVSTGTPAGNLFGKSINRQGTLYAPTGNLTPMAPGVVSPAGNNNAHDNMQPYLVMNYCIALEGEFPMFS